VRQTPIPSEFKKEVEESLRAFNADDVMDLLDGYVDRLQDMCIQAQNRNKAVAPREKTRIKSGCYQFDGEEGLFCTACYDTKGRKIRTARLNTKFRQCPSCKATLGSG
jgi:hypothetical protein